MLLFIYSEFQCVILVFKKKFLMDMNSVYPKMYDLPIIVWEQ